MPWKQTSAMNRFVDSILGFVPGLNVTQCDGLR